MTGIPRGCPRAITGHAAAPPRPAMNSRRRIGHASKPLCGSVSRSGSHGNGLHLGAATWRENVGRLARAPSGSLDPRSTATARLLILSCGKLHERIRNVFSSGHQKAVWDLGRDVNDVAGPERVPFSTLDARAQVLACTTAA